MGDPGIYEGYNDYVHAYDAQSTFGDESIQEAIARSAVSRHAQNTRERSQKTPSSSLTQSTGCSFDKPAHSRCGLSPEIRQETARPNTAMHAAGYKSAHNRGASCDHLRVVSITETKLDEIGEEKYYKLEKEVKDLLESSIFAWDMKDFKLALEKAEMACGKEKSAVKVRKQFSVDEDINLDLKFTALLNLAHQCLSSNLLNDALNTYQALIKNKMFGNSSRLKINIGNIYLKKNDYERAIKYYRMALDQLPTSQKRARMKVLNNIGISFTRTGEYEEALNAFEQCMGESADYGAALNLIFTAYCLDDVDKMKDAFLRLLEIPTYINDDYKYTVQEEVMLMQLTDSDFLKKWESERRQKAETTILMAARLISSLTPSICADSYTWSVASIKQSAYANIAVELEMDKAIEHLRRGDLLSASQALTVFVNEESKISGAAANNLSMLRLLQDPSKIHEIVQYSELSLNNDRYNPNALVNQGNIFFAMGDLDKAYQYYQEAWKNEASSVQALFNMAYVCRLQGKNEVALDYFYKFHNILPCNIEVLCQLAVIYEALIDFGQAVELYSQASSLAPSDPSILSKLASIYNAEGDTSQAYHCHYDSYRLFPSNLHVIEWLGAYYVDANLSDKAAHYFEKASIMQPNEIQWQLMIASCQRRSGNYQEALELYRHIHRRFPENIECLKFLVRICTDLRIPESKDFKEKLTRVQRAQQLRLRRENNSSYGKPHQSQNSPTQAAWSEMLTELESYDVISGEANNAAEALSCPSTCGQPVSLCHLSNPISNSGDELFHNMKFDESLLPE